MNAIDFAAVLAAWPQLLAGAVYTVVLTTLTLTAGFAIAIAWAWGRSAQNRLIAAACSAGVEAVRNTPMLVQLFFVYFGLAAWGLRMSPAVGAFLVITVNVGAYATEIVRAGLEATPRGHIDAGVSLALSRYQVFRHIMLRPALQRIYPALSSQFVMILLGSSIASQIGAEELTAIGSLIQSRTYRSLEVFVTIGAIYLLLAIGFRRLFSAIGRRWVYTS
jgi:polar amino acid transport system permease protein